MRLGTFNIQHGLRGDGKGVDVELVGRSAASLGLDVLALQEVDVGVPRSGSVDQAGAVARATGLRHAFAPAMQVEPAGRYGNALLVRGALRRFEARPLPRVQRHEPRVAIVAEVDLDAGGRLGVVATHLSVHRDEVFVQLDAALQLLGSLRAPCVLLGDLNLRPEELEPVVTDAGLRLLDAPPTFPAARPEAAIDHMVAGEGVRFGTVEAVPFAVSDHCALVVDASL